MGYAYTPGLTVAENTLVRQVRRLPLKGEVLVQVGQRVKADEVVARTNLPGEVKPVNVVGKLGIMPEELPELLLKREGESVARDEPFVRTKGFFGLFKSECHSPIDGTLESISQVTGQVIIRGAPIALNKLAYVDGTVVDVEEGESATIEANGTLIQGIFGIGGEVWGELAVAVETPHDVLDADAIRPEHAGKVIVGGSLVTADAVKQAVRTGVKGIICGGLNDADLRDFLGYELGVAITGEETLGTTLVITEGFGEIRMAKATFALLKKREGRRASINGATQIRAGVIRPEVIIPVDEARGGSDGQSEADSALRIGTPIRAIREPFFGRIGTCLALPVGLTALPSEAMVRILEVEFEGGERAFLPRANVELIRK